MNPSAPREFVCAHSPDSDDAFMFYAMATRKVRSNSVVFKHLLEDIESLNQRAMRGEYEFTAISFHAYPYVADKYRLVNSGCSVGDGYGPMVVSSSPMQIEQLKGKRIAIPGKLTTAYLTLRIIEPDFEAIVVPFDKVLDALREKSVDAALVIHEAQLTYGRGGHHLVVDLGKWFRQVHDLPLPLGANALLKSVDDGLQVEICRMMRESIQYALDHHEEALNYAMQFARDLEPALAEKFVGMYVNHYTVDAGRPVRDAAQKLLDLGFEAGVIPSRVQVEFIG
jgi:1,4-dihydroxy-6-naphthoate synthase